MQTWDGHMYQNSTEIMRVIIPVMTISLTGRLVSGKKIERNLLILTIAMA